MSGRGPCGTTGRPGRERRRPRAGAAGAAPAFPGLPAVEALVEGEAAAAPGAIGQHHGRGKPVGLGTVVAERHDVAAVHLVNPAHGVEGVAGIVLGGGADKDGRGRGGRVDGGITGTADTRGFHPGGIGGESGGGVIQEARFVLPAVVVDGAVAKAHTDDVGLVAGAGDTVGAEGAEQVVGGVGSAGVVVADGDDLRLGSRALDLSPGPQ